MRHACRFISILGLLLFSAAATTQDVNASEPREPCYLTSEMDLLEGNSDYCVSQGTLEVRDPQTGEERVVVFRFYQTRLPGVHPLMLVLPPLTGTIPFVERSVARKFSRSGTHALIIEAEELIRDIDLPPETINDYFRHSQSDIVAMLDYTQTWPLFTGDVGVMGVSLGGIRAALAFNALPRLKTLVTYVAGGDLPSIFAVTDVPLLVKYRKHWMAKLSLPTVEAFEAHLRKVLTWDPLDGASADRSSNVFMVQGSRDEKVPFRSQELLWKAYGEPQRIVVDGGHRVAGSSFLWNFDRVIHFLRRRTPLTVRVGN